MDGQEVTVPRKLFRWSNPSKSKPNPELESEPDPKPEEDPEEDCEVGVRYVSKLYKSNRLQGIYPIVPGFKFNRAMTEVLQILKPISYDR